MDLKGRHLWRPRYISLSVLNSVQRWYNIDDGTAIANVDASKVDTYCHTGDNICVNGDLVLPAHLTYAENAAAAAAFVLS
jgi:hypothetical protein